MMAGGWEGLKKAKKNNIINVLPLTCMSTNSLVCNMLSFYLIKDSFVGNNVSGEYLVIRWVKVTSHVISIIVSVTQ